MNNRIRNIHKNIPNIETLLKDIEGDFANTFSGIDFVPTAGQILPSWQVDAQKIMLYEKYKRANGARLNSSQEVTDLIDAINSVYNILKDPEAPETFKATLEYMYSWTVAIVSMPPDDKYSKELFDRRAETPSDNPVMFNFLDNVIDMMEWERFEQAKYNEMKKKGIDIDAYEENLTEAERRKNSQDYDRNFDAICREYGLTDHARNRTDDYYTLPDEEQAKHYPKPAFSFLDKLPKGYHKKWERNAEGT